MASSRLFKRTGLTGLFGALVIAGFYLSSSAGSALSVGSKVTYAERAGVVLLAALLIAIGLRAQTIRSPRLLLLLLLFGFLYVLKAFYAYAVVATVPLEQAAYAVVYLSAVCVIPAVVPHVTKKYPWSDAWVVAICLLALVAFGVSIYFQGAMAALGVDQQRLSLEAMGPIQVGHLGATCCIVALAARGRGWIAFRGCLLMGGLLLIGFSGTRSALVALLICLGMLAYRNRSSTLTRLVLLVAAALVVASLFWLANQEEVVLVERVTSLADSSDNLGSGRIDIYKETLAEIAKHPLFGAGLTFLRSDVYPHNLILEAFFATGLVGGTLIVMYFGFAAAGVRRHMVRGSVATLLPPLLFVQYFVAAMMSGAIYAWGQLWFLAAVLIAWKPRATVDHVPSGAASRIAQ